MYAAVRRGPNAPADITYTTLSGK